MYVENYKYRLLKSDGTSLLLKCVTDAVVTYDSDSKLKQSATVSITQVHSEDLSLKDRIQIVHCLDGIETPVGTFIINTPVKTLYKGFKDYNVTCYSTLWLIYVNKVTTRYLVPKGTQIVQEVLRIMQTLGYQINITPSTASTNIDIEFIIGTSYLDICNELLKIINYTSLFVDGEGVYTTIPYIEPSSRNIDFEYSEDDPNNRLIDVCTQSLDTFNVPNKFVRYVNNPDVELVAIYENKNSQNPTSMVNAPVNVSVVEVKDAADLQVLHDIAKKDCIDVNSYYSTVEIETAVNPKHLYDNCVSLKLNTIDTRFIEKVWTFQCQTGSLMKHTLREVVAV